MSEDSTDTDQTAQTEQTDQTAQAEQTEQTAQSGSLDLSAAADYEARLEALEQQAAAQREQIEALDDLMLDLSTRVADGQNIGVCPDCNGPLERISRLVRADTIECTDCGKVVHTY